MLTHTIHVHAVLESLTTDHNSNAHSKFNMDTEKIEDSECIIYIIGKNETIFNIVRVDLSYVHITPKLNVN
jgi:hypothetical protein